MMVMSEWFNQFSLDKIIGGDFSIFIPIFYLAISIAVYAILIWHFYRFIARRDCFKPTTKKHTKTIQILKYTFLFPLIAIGFFIGFALMLFFLTKELDTFQVLATSFSIIIAIRITAYYTEDLSKDLAKLLPLALLGVFLVERSYFNFQDVVNKIYAIPNFLTVCIQFIFFMVIIEWILRGLLNLRNTIIAKKQAKPVKKA
jgi:hypothetical protein